MVEIDELAANGVAVGVEDVDEGASGNLDPPRGKWGNSFLG